MQVINIKSNDLSKPSLEFKNYFDSFLNLCEFKEEEKLGILFYIGATLPGHLKSFGPESSKFKQYLKALSLYSKSSGNFEDYGDLDQNLLIDFIYNINIAISKIRKNDTPIDSNLRKFKGRFFWKSGKKIDFVSSYKHDSFNLNTVQNLNDELFISTGIHLKKKGYELERAHEAGFAFRMMMNILDAKGTYFLFSMIRDTLSPLYMSLFHGPILFALSPKIFKANHLFSQILNNLIGGSGSKLMSIVQPIHTYHRLIFYKKNSTELRDMWTFNKNGKYNPAQLVFVYALKIRETNIKIDTKLIKKSGEIYNSKIIDKQISHNDFLKVILDVISSKYSINGYEEFIKDSDNKRFYWNNKGDYMQFLAILFYETCLHVLVLKELK